MISRRLLAIPALAAAFAVPALAAIDGKPKDKTTLVDIHASGASKTHRFAPGEILFKLKNAPAPVPGLSESADALSALANVPAFAAFQRRHRVKKAEPIFQGNSSVTPSAAPRHGGSAHPQGIYRIALEDAHEDVAALSRELAADPSVAYAEPNFLSEIQVVPTDPLYPQQWAHKLTSAEPAWDITRGNSSVVVAVVDVGVDYTHEDLAANIVPGFDETDIDVSLYASSGYIAEAGEDYTTPDNDPMDFNGHGTHCAGIVAAVADNGKGVSGVAPGVKLMPVRAGFEMSDAGGNRFGFLENDDIANAIVWATDHGADVISMSFGSPDPSDVVANAIAYARSHGVVLVAAAGNSALALPFYPAALPGVISIAAVNQQNNPAYYSNRGFWVSLAAPGGDAFHDSQILSTVPKTGGALTDPSGYRAISGTSMACPYAAGVAALILSKNPTWTPDNVAAIMKHSVDPVGGPYYIGAGRINILKALQAASAPNVAITVTTPASGASFNGGTVSVAGSVGGGATSSYQLAWGAGVYPTAWTNFGSGSAPVSNAALGNLDVTGFAAGTYTLRVTGFENGDHLDEFVRIQVDPALRAGWPQKADFFGGTGFQTGFAQAPTIADVDGDGKSDLVVLSNTKVSVFRQDGTPLPGWPQDNLQGSTNGQTQSAAVGDLDGDGKAEVVVSFTDNFGNDGVHVFNRDGSLRFTSLFPSLEKNWLLQPKLIDIDGDGKKEILQKTWNNSSPTSGTVSIFRFDGSPMPGWPKSIGSQYTAELRFSEVAAADIDGDGKKEIITLQFNSNTSLPSLFIWNLDGTLRAGYPKDLAIGPGDNPQYGPFVADIDHDGKPEIGFVRNIGGCGSNSGQFTFVRPDGTTLPGWPGFFSDQIPSEAVSFGDLDGDGKFETVFGSLGACNPDLGPAVNVLRSDGTPMPNWPQRLPLGMNWAQVAVADVTGDGKPEVIVGSDKGAVYAWTAAGTMVPGFPRNLGAIEGDEVSVKSTPAIGDVDGDGKADLAATGVDGRVFLWNLNTALSASQNEWRMYQGDALHSAFRFAASPNAPLAFEAENLARTSSAVGTSVAVNQTGASNLAFVQFNAGPPAPAVGDWMEFTLPNLPAGNYNIKVQYKSNTNRAISKITIDGATQGGSLDEYSATPTQGLVFNAGSKTLTAGNHKIRFTNTGRNASSTAYTFVVDKVTLTPIVPPPPPQTLEAENLARTSTSTVTTAVESDVNFSAGKSVKVNTSATSQYVEFTTSSLAAGAYGVKVYYKSANNRPKAQLKIDGTVQGGTVDMYSSATAFQAAFDFGVKTFASAGTHKFRLTTTSKNSSSSGYVMHIDKFVVTPQ